MGPRFRGDDRGEMPVMLDKPAEAQDEVAALIADFYRERLR